MGDITIGQYYSTESILHKLDPRTKIIGIFIYLLSLFLFDGFSGYIVAISFFALMVLLSKVPVRFIFRGLKPVIIILIFTAALNLFWTKGTVIWSFYSVEITKEGLYKSAFMAVRLILLVIASSLLTLSTTPKELTDGLEQLFKPLNRLGVPVDEFAMVISIALRFIPILVEEFSKIKKAQLSRGADLEEGSVFHRLKAMTPLIIPLFVAAAKRASDLAYALEARCWYGGMPHTKMKPLRITKKDIFAGIAIVAYLIILSIAIFCYR